MTTPKSERCSRTLGILGGGQLGRMLALAAQPLGIDVTVLDPNPEAPARSMARHVAAPFDDQAGLEELAQSDFLTFEFENIPDDVVRSLESKSRVSPCALALRTAQDRWVEKNAFLELGIPTAAFRQIDSLDQAIAAYEELGPIVLKTRRFGYDGKGQAVVRKREELEAGYSSLNGAPAIAEELIPFQRELSIIVCRGQGEGPAPVEIYPLTENVHRSGILHASTAPALELTEELSEQANTYAKRLVEHLDYVGVLALELFQVEGRLLANEFAPRVHNSGHWTIEGAVTSQFENHVRAVTGLPLGSAALRCPTVMVNLIGRVPPLASLLQLTDTHVHDYAKSPRAGRKVGHVTCLGKTTEEAKSRAALVEQKLEP